MNFSVLPPEINSLRIFSGAGPAPMLEAAAAWDGVAGELASSAALFDSVTSGLVDAAWQGAASQAMAATAASYIKYLNAVTAQAGQVAAQARTMASAFEAVRAATVHPGGASRSVVGFGLVRSGSAEVGAVGEIVGVYGQARTEGDPADGLVSVCPVRVARRVPCW